MINDRACIKSSGKESEQCLREMTNNYVESSMECPKEVNEANRQMEYYKLLCFIRKTREQDRAPHQTNGSVKEKMFRIEIIILVSKREDHNSA